MRQAASCAQVAETPKDAPRFDKVHGPSMADATQAFGVCTFCGTPCGRT